MDIVLTRLDWEKHFRAPDGLVSLKRDYFKNPFAPATLKSCDNENGILFLAECLILLEDLGQLNDDIKQNGLRALNNIALFHHTPKYYGLYHRRPHWTTNTDSHDNGVGQAAVAVMCDDERHLKGLVMHSFRDWRTLWGVLGGVYDNVHPETPHILRWRQPSEIAFYRLCYGVYPGALGLWWLMMKIWYNSTQFERVMNAKHTSPTLLTWVRIKVLRKKAETAKWYMRPFYWIALLHSSEWERSLNWWTKGKGIEGVINVYFTDDSHAIHGLAKDKKI